MRRDDTFVQVFRRHLAKGGGKVACTFLATGGEPRSITYAQLDRRARGVALALGPEARGQRVLLIYPPGLDFVAGFLGCLYAGAVAVPVYPPRGPQMLSRLHTIAVDAGAARYLATGKMAAELASMSAEAPWIGTMAGIVTDVVEDVSGDWREPDIQGGSLAFLQYTSGSTAAPKGVAVTHSNLVCNQRMIASAMRHDRDLVVVGWLPLYHDMGLIGMLLQPLYLGARTVMIAPADFVRRPALWLKAISDYRGATSGAPNFAYELCVQRISAEEKAGLDLSSWKVAFNGAEPVRTDTLERFSAAFRSCGFDAGACYPCYGLAEATLMVSAGTPGAFPANAAFDRAKLEQNQAVEGDGDAVRLVSSGVALPGEEMAIVDPETGRALGDGKVGEIWVAGPHIASGYWGKAEETERVFNARLEGRSARFLRTGDLGFLRDGELFVTGRIKDMLIVRGRNLYPHDIELTVTHCHPALRATGAAFALEAEGGEELALVHEVSPDKKIDLSEVIAAVRAAVTAEHDVEPRLIALVRPNSVPLTSSGKVRRRACREAFLNGSLKILAQERASPDIAPPPASPCAGATDATALREWLAIRFAQKLNIAPESIGLDAPFDRFGLDSIKSIALIVELESKLGRPLPATLAFEYPTIRRLAAHLAGDKETATPSPAAIGRSGAEAEPIVVIGMACRFPKAPDLDAYWRLLCEGGDGVGAPSAQRARAPAPETRAGYLDEIDGFDAAFFGVPPREASVMDPQQRLVLEVAWEALEDAGLRPDLLSGERVGMFLGASHSDYARLVWRDPRRADAWSLTGNALSIAASRLAYLIDLRGPALAIDTACSSSLVAVHTACRSLLDGEAETALAGGVNLLLSVEPGMALGAAGVLSQSGRCRPFDPEADGYVRGEGCGMVVLTRLSTAERTGARVLAVIRGSAINQDGRTNGLTSPSGAAQAEVIRAALAAAGLAPSQVGYVEAHGTGTPIGDRIELRALGAVFGHADRGDPPCAVGSVKGVFGHLEAAAGIAGLIKTVLALEHGQLPPQPGARMVRAAGPGLEINGILRPWPSGRRVAGVSSFGLSGVNAHVVVEAAPARDVAPDPRRGLHILQLAASGEAALRADAERLARLLEQANDAADVCFTVNTGRAALPRRLAVVGADGPTLAAQLRAASVGPAGQVGTNVQNREPPLVCFLFSGQGTQFPAMGAQLYRDYPVYREAIERCDAGVRRSHGLRLRDVLLDGSAPIHATEWAQPALVALEVGLSELWRSWGIVPAAVVGHSVGELVAAHVAGALSLEEVMALAAERGRLMGALPRGGAMATVRIAEARLAPRLAGGAVTVACYNGPDSLVLSGPCGELEDLIAQLQAEGVAAQLLNVSHAFHSPLIEPMLAPLAVFAASLRPQPPQIPLFSNVTGEAMVTAPDVDYWRRQARAPVRFADCVRGALAAGCRVFVEIGPRPMLTALTARLGGLPPELVLTASLGGETGDDAAALLASLAKVSLAGVAVDWRGFDAPYRRRRVSVPPRTYERRRHWFDDAPAGGAGFPPQTPRLGGILDRCLDEPRPSARYVRRFAASDPWIAHHCIGVMPVLAAAVHLELALAAAAHHAGHAALDLADVTLMNPLAIGGETDVEVALRGEGGAVRWTISSEERECSSGLAVPAAVVLPAQIDIAALVARCPKRIDGAHIYPRMAAAGLGLGPAYQSLVWLRTNENEVLARLERPDGAATSALIDGAFQSLVGFVLDAQAAQIPAHVGRVHISAALPAVVYAHARRRPDGADIRLLDESGATVAVLEKVELRPAPAGLLLAHRKTDPAALIGPGLARTLALSWSVSPLRTGGKAPRAWLLLADAGGAAARLQAHLQAAGDWCAQAALDDLRVEDARRHGAVTLVDLRPLDGGLTEEGIAVLGASIARVVTSLASAVPAKWWMATRGAMAAQAQDRPDPGAAALCGLARTVALEQPSLFGGFVDLDPLAPPGEEALLAEALLQTGEDEQALRGGRRLTPRLRPTVLPWAPPLVCRPDATYLITGGLGDLALEAAGWLADRGARRLLLIARTGLPPRNLWPMLPPGVEARRAAAVERLERRGVAVELAVADVGDEAALHAVLASQRVPVAGVLHLAGVAGEATLASLDAGVLRRALHAKATGATQLDRLTGDLDFWVVFSSLASICGAPGQAAYAAANAYLDALALARRARGLKALSVSFGPWTAGGMAERAAEGSPQTRLGRLTPAAAFDALERLIASDAAHAVEIGFEMRELAALSSVAGERSVLRDLFSPAPGGAVPAWVPGRQSLIDHLAAEVASVLGIEANAIHPEKPLSALGLDSLMAIELRNRIHRDLRVLPSLSALISGGVAAIADDLLPQLATPTAPVTGKREPEGPLSRGQRALWFLAQLAPESTAYNVGEALHIRGALDAEAMRRVFLRLAERHEALRTVFIEGDDGPRQRPLANLDPDFAILTAPDGDDAELRRRLVEEIDRPYDLQRGPLVRIRIYRRGADDHVMLFAMHHIVEDFWSLVLILREAGKLYRAERDGAPPPPPPALQFADYVRWQEAMLVSAEGERLWSYWAERLAGDLPMLSLPMSRPRPSVKTYAGQTRLYHFGPELAERLHVFASREGVTNYTVLLAAFFALLHRYSGSEDLIVGSPAAGRSRPEFSDVIGYFDNPLPLRARVEAQQSFLELVTQTRDVVLGALEHQDLPFATMVERLNPVRDPSRSPLFDVMFVLRKAQSEEAQGLTMASLGDERTRLDFAGLEVAPMPLALSRDEAQFDLTLALAEIDGTLSASIEFNRDLFDATAIDGVAAAYAALLGAVLATPNRAIETFPLVDAETRHRGWTTWNGPRVARVGAPLLHELFEARLRAAPRAPAVVAGAVTLDYAELDRLSNAIAAQLESGRDELVAVAMHKGWEQVVAVLAVLKAGAAFLPVDPTLPSERIRQLFERCGVREALTQPELADFGWPARVVRVSRHHAPTGERRAAAAAPSDLAYVLFTSGSTGEPKGVMIEHRAAANTIIDVNRRFAVKPGDRVLALSSLSFDLSVFDIFGALAAGATIVIPEATRADDPSHWRELVERERVTIWNSVPILFQLFLQHCGAAAPPPSLRLALLSGDWIPLPLARQARALSPEMRLVSLGGATEAAIWSVWFPIDRVDPNWRSVPYGRPMENQSIVVLDAAQEICPPWVTGDLYIGGDGLARGYWRDDERTRASFVTHPNGERLYRTGDLARYDDDGRLEFLGRADQQIKLAGFRIELGEIEAALTSHPRVREAAVAALPKAAGGRSLTAYYVSDGPIEPIELRVYLQAKLPRHMVPSSYVNLPALPLSANGKLDRRALAAPPMIARAKPVAPRTPTESHLLEAWREALNLEDLGVEDDFFEIGGDSVAAIRLAIAASRRGVPLTPRDIAERPTVAALASHVDARATGVESLPLTSWQRRALADGIRPALWLAQFRLLRPLDPASLAEALNALVARHDALRLMLRPDGSQTLGGGGTLLSPAVSFEQAAAELIEGLCPRRGVLVGAALPLGGLLLALHAFGADRDSLPVVFQDLERILDGASMSEAGSFVGWLKTQPAADETAAELCSSPSSFAVGLPPEETSALLSLSRERHRAEPAEVALVAAAVALASRAAGGEATLEVETRRELVLHAHTVGPLAEFRLLQATATDPVPLSRIKQRMRRAPLSRGGSGSASFAFLALPRDLSWLQIVNLATPPATGVHIEARLDGGLELRLSGGGGLEALAEAILAELRRLGREVEDEPPATYTPADFPFANLSQLQLEGLLRRLREG